MSASISNDPLITSIHDQTPCTSKALPGVLKRGCSLPVQLKKSLSILIAYVTLATDIMFPLIAPKVQITTIAATIAAPVVPNATDIASEATRDDAATFSTGKTYR